MQELLAGVTGFFSGPAGELIGVWVAAVLTLAVFSYLFSDTVLFRLAQALFVGVAAGYAAIIAWHTVLAPRVGEFLKAPASQIGLMVWIVLGILLMMRRLPGSVSWVNQIPVAFLFGVGAALAVGGALSGIIVPQLAGMLVSLNPADNGGGTGGLELALFQGVVIFLTLGALLYFFFSTPEDSALPKVWIRVANLWGRVGRWVILITFGAVFGGLVMSRVSLLLGRMQFLLGDWLGLIP